MTRRLTAVSPAFDSGRPRLLVVLGVWEAVACAHVEGPAAGLARLDALAGARRLAHYALYHALRGDFLEKLGRLDKAREAFAAALECPLNAAERAYLERKLAG